MVSQCGFQAESWSWSCLKSPNPYLRAGVQAGAPCIPGDPHLSPVPATSHPRLHHQGRALTAVQPVSASSRPNRSEALDLLGLCERCREQPPLCCQAPCTRLGARSHPRALGAGAGSSKAPRGCGCPGPWGLCTGVLQTWQGPGPTADPFGAEDAGLGHGH